MKPRLMIEIILKGRDGRSAYYDDMFIRSFDPGHEIKVVVIKEASSLEYIPEFYNLVQKAFWAELNL